MNESIDKGEANTLGILNFSGANKVPVIVQSERSECGLASLAMVAAFFGYKSSIGRLRSRFNLGGRGSSLEDLMSIGHELGLSSRALQCPLDELDNLSLPCILHWDMDHFVTLTKVTGQSCTIHDPAIGKRVLALTEVSNHFTGIVLELSPSSEFQQLDDNPSMKITQLWSRVTSLQAPLLSLILPSFFLQLFLLASPFYLQTIVDDVLVGADHALLVILAIGFTFLLAQTITTRIVRGWLTLRLSNMLSLQMSTNLMRHMLRLPQTYFERRHAGDLISRFDSLDAVREQLTHGVIETIVDGVLTCFALVIMFSYSPFLTFIVLGAIALYVGIRLVWYRPYYHANQEAILASATEQTNFLENIRGIQTIRLFNKEPQRQGLWQNLFGEVLNADIRIGRLKIWFDAAENAVFGIENIVVLYIAALAVINGELTVGMVLAFIAFKLMLTDSAQNVIEELIQFRMLKLHLERVADIAMEPQESNRPAKVQLSEPKGNIELQNICFRYSSNEPEILKDLSIKIGAGESVAIIGKSGCGKTSLIKVLLGLLEPTDGKILFDGYDLQALGVLQYREQLASVMQDDTLLTGSILDNVTFFEVNPDIDFVIECCRYAEVHAEIEAMPMGYDTLVGDMGSVLSGGQAQRILLARALYKQPSVLILDEATSHLDIANEKNVSFNIAKLSITRIIVAHRPDTFKQADRVFELSDGKLTEQPVS